MVVRLPALSFRPLVQSVFVAAILATLLSPLGWQYVVLAQDDEVESSSGGLAIFAYTDRQAYKVGEVIEVEVSLVNVSNEAISFQDLGKAEGTPPMPILRSQTYEDGGRGWRKCRNLVSPIRTMTLQPGEDVSRRFSFHVREPGAVVLEAYFARTSIVTPPELWTGAIESCLDLCILNELDQDLLEAIEKSEIELRSQSANDRLAAIEALGDIGYATRDVLLRHLSRLPQASARERSASVRALLAMSRQAFCKDLVAQLIQIASDPAEDTSVRLEAFGVFETILISPGRLSIPLETVEHAAQQLLEMQYDRDESIRHRAREALEGTGARKDSERGRFPGGQDGTGHPSDQVSPHKEILRDDTGGPSDPRQPRTGNLANDVDLSDGEGSRIPRSPCGIQETSPSSGKTEETHATPGALSEILIAGAIAAVAAILFALMVLRRR